MQLEVTRFLMVRDYVKAKAKSSHPVHKALGTYW